MRKPAFCRCENKGEDQLISPFVFATQIVQPLYEGGSIYNGNTLITQLTNAPEVYTICEKKDQGFTFRMVHKTLFYLNYLFRHRLLKKAHSNTLDIFSSGLKRNTLTKLGRYAVISKGNCLQQ